MGAKINVGVWISFINSLPSNFSKNNEYCSSPYVGLRPTSFAHQSSYSLSFLAPVPGNFVNARAHPSDPSVRIASCHDPIPIEKNVIAAGGKYVGLEQMINECSRSGYLAANAMPSMPEVLSPRKWILSIPS